MSMYDDLQKEMGVKDNTGDFINLKAGSAPVVAKFVKLESAPCTEKEMVKSSYGEGYAFCRPNGRTFLYTFESVLNGGPQIMRSEKDTIFWAFQRANILPGDFVWLERTGTTKEDTRYVVKKLTEEAAKSWAESRKQEIAEAEEAMAPIPAPTEQPPASLPNQDPAVNPSDIPF